MSDLLPAAPRIYWLASKAEIIKSAGKAAKQLQRKRWPPSECLR